MGFLFALLNQGHAFRSSGHQQRIATNLLHQGTTLGQHFSFTVPGTHRFLEFELVGLNQCCTLVSAEVFKFWINKHRYLLLSGSRDDAGWILKEPFVVVRYHHSAAACELSHGFHDIHSSNIGHRLKICPQHLLTA